MQFYYKILHPLHHGQGFKLLIFLPLILNVASVSFKTSLSSAACFPHR